MRTTSEGANTNGERGGDGNKVKQQGEHEPGEKNGGREVGRRRVGGSVSGMVNIAAFHRSGEAAPVGGAPAVAGGGEVGAPGGATAAPEGEAA
uniref:Uncharacterized protein n=1 Tax=Toxoplasma gondii COUG TaxID=1074873 RepID=A0A2G8Y9V5_TOXGO|nr:hypothetical protein TGCOUG_226320B [Toxoplasma gondii COUG]